MLVRESNRAIGSSPKITAHQLGLLHRAFSVFLVDDKGRLLLQQRNTHKYHSGGLWANTCCGHPCPGERTIAAATRRLLEEMGVSSRLIFLVRTRYCAWVGPEMVENELVYLYFGKLHEPPRPNPVEVGAIDYLTLNTLVRSCAREPHKFSAWLLHYVANHCGDLRRAVDGTRHAAA